MIVIPMAGNSSRFFKAGYTQPKYELRAHNKTLFAHSVKSFQRYFTSEPFLFIVRKDFNASHFVKTQCELLGIADFSIYELESVTRGQAETVFKAIEHQETDDCLTIFNIDTFRPDYIKPDFTVSCDGYLDVFVGDGDNWSYAKVKDGSNQVVETAEKSPISNLCSTGLYYFKSANAYRQAFLNEIAKPESQWHAKELYIAPLYNTLIEQGCDIRVDITPSKSVIFCGLPSEYTDFLNQN